MHLMADSAGESADPLGLRPERHGAGDFGDVFADGKGFPDQEIALLDDYQNVALKMADWSALSGKAEITVFNQHLGSPENIVAKLQGFQVVCMVRERTAFPREVVEKLPDLKLVLTNGMRNPALDLKAAGERGIVFCGTGGKGAPTAELAWGLILSLARHIPFEHRAMQEGRWQTTMGNSIEGKTLGILGLGKLGSRVAKIGQAFDMKVIAWSQNLTAEAAAAQGAKLVSKDEFFAQSDFISVHLVLSPRSRGLVGERELGLMKKTAYIVNTSRGPIIDEAALLKALSAKKIGGAGLDVYSVEPLPASDPIRKLDNVVLTPHLGYVVEESYRHFYPEMIEDIKAWMGGKPIRVITS